ncbi:MAG: SRPBCC domain-containing protein [Hyphococcus sp.]
MRGAFGWKLFLRSPIEEVFAALATDKGRARFWAEKTLETNEQVAFFFPNGQKHVAEVLEKAPPNLFSIRYFGAVTTFDLREQDAGVVVNLTVSEAAEDDWLESYAGWVSVLMNLKAVLDFDADLRNHDSAKSWDQRFVDN